MDSAIPVAKPRPGTPQAQRRAMPGAKLPTGHGGPGEAAEDSLASTLREQGRHAETEAMEREVLEAEREVLGPRHPETLETMSNLASTLAEQGKRAEAEAMQREVLEAQLPAA